MNLDTETDSPTKITLGEGPVEPSVNLIVVCKDPVMFIKKNSIPGPNTKEKQQLNPKAVYNGTPVFATTIKGSHG